MSIHPSSVIADEVEMAEDVRIGPFCVITGQVKIGAGTRLENHVTIGSAQGIVEIGKNNHFFPGSVIGAPPQDLSYRGEQTKLVVGDNNEIRECVTLNLATVKAGGITHVGSDNLIMAYSHIAHDCYVGNNTVIANSCQLAGHVVIEDHAKVGGACCISQFITIGGHAYIAGDSTANKDIAPFTVAQGSFAVMRAANHIGMARFGYPKAEVDSIRRAVRILIKGKSTVKEAIERMRRECETSEPFEQFVKFIENSKRGLAL